MLRIIMYSNVPFSIITAAIILSLGTTCVITTTTPAMGSSKGNREGGPVVQELVKTGNSGLDKEINKFYNCISKTHQDPPTIEKVDSCYNQTVGGTRNNIGSTAASNFGLTGSGTSPTSISQHHKT